MNICVIIEIYAYETIWNMWNVFYKIGYTYFHYIIYSCTYTGDLNYVGLNCTGPLTCGCFAVNACKCIFSSLWFLIFLLKNYFIVVQLQLSAFPPHCSPPTPAIPTSLPWFHPSLVLSMCPLQLFLKSLHPHYPLPPSLWLLSDCSLFQCLQLYFACLFVLLIRFHLKVRSYGICLSLPGLFHLA